VVTGRFPALSALAGQGHLWPDDEHRRGNHKDAPGSRESTGQCGADVCAE